MAHSLATATGTRVDSASKHIVPCKVSTDYMASLISSQHADNAMRELQVCFCFLFHCLSINGTVRVSYHSTKKTQINKHRYSMAKDNIVIGLGRPMYGSSVHANRKKAYPSVITTLGQMEPEARRWIAVHNFLCRSYLDSDHMKKTYLVAICSDGEPGNEELKKAYKSAGVQQDRKKHVRFQVRFFCVCCGA
jgi:hypothetical protein